MLTIRLNEKRLKKLLARARSLRKHGDLHAALALYTQAMHLCGANEEQRICCLYLMAFTHVLIDHQQTQYNALGVDFRHHHTSQLEDAYQCLKVIDTDYFDPKHYGLPSLTNDELHQVFQNHQATKAA